MNDRVLRHNGSLALSVGSQMYVSQSRRTRDFLFLLDRSLEGRGNRRVVKESGRRWTFTLSDKEWRKL